jgi:hypothetical protein
VQETVCKNNSRVLLLDQCDESLQASRHRGSTVIPDADARFPWQIVTTEITVLAFCCFWERFTKLICWCFLYKQTCWMLGVELFQWCQSTRPTGWQKFCFFTVSYHLWLNVLRHVLYTPTNSVIWKRDFQYFFHIPRQTIFTILQHVGKITDSAIVCDFIFFAKILSMAWLASWDLSEIVVILVHCLA